MAYIYKITNIQNGKIYIGKTLGTVEERFKEHCRDSKKERCEKRPLYSAMRKYGIDAFKVETIEECSADTSSEREIYWIEHYNSFHNGYNATMGGDGKHYVDYDEIYSLWKQGKIIKEISQITGRDENTIRTALNNNGVTKEERLHRAAVRQGKPVCQLDKNTNQILGIFENSNDAARQVFKDKECGKHILEVCQGKRKTAYGYKWVYAENLGIKVLEKT